MGVKAWEIHVGEWGEGNQLKMNTTRELNVFKGESPSAKRTGGRGAVWIKEACKEKPI